MFNKHLLNPYSLSFTSKAQWQSLSWLVIRNWDINQKIYVLFSDLTIEMTNSCSWSTVRILFKIFSFLLYIWLFKTIFRFTYFSHILSLPWVLPDPLLSPSHTTLSSFSNQTQNPMQQPSEENNTPKEAEKQNKTNTKL